MCNTYIYIYICANTLSFSKDLIRDEHLWDIQPELGSTPEAIRRRNIARYCALERREGFAGDTAGADDPTNIS